MFPFGTFRTHVFRTLSQITTEIVRNAGTFRTLQTPRNNVPNQLSSFPSRSPSPGKGPPMEHATPQEGKVSSRQQERSEAKGTRVGKVRIKYGKKE